MLAYRCISPSAHRPPRHRRQTGCTAFVSISACLQRPENQYWQHHGGVTLGRGEPGHTHMVSGSGTSCVSGRNMTSIPAIREKTAKMSIGTIASVTSDSIAMYPEAPAPIRAICNDDASFISRVAESVQSRNVYFYFPGNVRCQVYQLSIFSTFFYRRDSGRLNLVHL